MRLDDIDLALLALLQDDARLSVVELAERVGLSASPCLRRIRRLEEEGAIEAYRAVLDRAALGLGLTAFVEIKVDRQGHDSPDLLAVRLVEIPQVVACHMISGAADFLLEIVVADLAAYERLLSERLLAMPMVADIRTSFSLRRVRSEGRLPLPAPAATATPDGQARQTRARRRASRNADT
jgi:Lrp/AsnC family leucine-responsive transcriptional regulator